MKKLVLFYLSLFTILHNGISQTVCNNIQAEDIDVIEYNCQTATVVFCLPIEDILDYDIFINNELQTEFQPCGELVQNAIYSLNGLLNNSNTSFDLESWTTNGNTFSGSFNNLQELADSLSIWDSPVTWVANETALVVQSTSTTNEYSPMLVRAIINGQTTVSELASNLIFRPGAFSVATAIQSNYPIEIVNKVENCIDNIFIEDEDIETNIQVDCQNFAPPGATWHFQNFSSESSGTLFSRIESDRDTTIITAQGESVLVSILEISMNGIPIPEGRLLIREVGGKVYFYEDNAFRLMYDFTLNAGDASVFQVPKNRRFYSFACNDEGIYQIRKEVEVFVDSVSFIENQGQQLKVLHTRPMPYYFECHEFGVITERIGSEYGFFGQICMQCLEGFTGNVRCYSDNLVDIKLSDEDCDFGINTSTFNLGNFDIDVYPNPAKNNLFIDSDIDLSAYRLTDLSGKVLIHQKDYINGNGISINSMNAGLYFLELFDNQGRHIYTEKIIVNKG